MGDRQQKDLQYQGAQSVGWVIRSGKVHHGPANARPWSRPGSPASSWCAQQVTTAAPYPGQTTGYSNEGWGTAYGSIASPGNDPYVITVGATKSIDGIRAHDQSPPIRPVARRVWTWSLSPTLSLQATNIISTLADGSYLDTEHRDTNLVSGTVYLLTGILFGDSNKYFVLSGTSMATPVVAGSAALLLQKYRNTGPGYCEGSDDDLRGQVGRPDREHGPVYLRRGLSECPGGSKLHGRGNAVRHDPDTLGGCERQCLHQYGPGNLGISASGEPA